MDISQWVIRQQSACKWFDEWFMVELARRTLAEQVMHLALAGWRLSRMHTIAVLGHAHVWGVDAIWWQYGKPERMRPLRRRAK